MIRRITAAEVEKDFTSILQGLERGQYVIITSNGHDIARLDPIVKSEIEEERREKARKVLFEHLNNVKAVDAGPWTRAELYEDRE